MSSVENAHKLIIFLSSRINFVYSCSYVALIAQTGDRLLIKQRASVFIKIVWICLDMNGF